MRKILPILFVVVALFGSCTNADTDQMGAVDGKLPISISLNVEPSRANDTTFESGDQLGLYVVNHTNSGAGSLASYNNHIDNMRFTLLSDWTPDESIYWLDHTTKADFYAYYPYGEVSNVNAYAFSVKNDQSNEANYWASDFLWGKRTNVAPTADAVAIETEHLFSNALVYVVAGEGVTPEMLAEADVEVTVCNVKTSATINLATGTATATGATGEIKPWNTGSYYRAMIVPQSVSSSNDLLLVKINGEEYTYATDIVFEQNTRHKITITVESSTDFPSNKFKVTFSIKPWNDDEFDYGGSLNKKEDEKNKDFAVTFSDQTPVSATATVTVLDEANKNMVWGAFTFGQSVLVQNGGPMPLNTRDASMMDPAEYALSYLTEAAGPMGYGGLYFFFYQMAGYGTHLSEMMGNAVNCSLYSWNGVEEKMYIAIVGINKKNVDIDMWIDESTMATPINVFEVKTLPQPSIKVAKDAFSLSYEGGSESCAVQIANPYGEGTVMVEATADWVVPFYTNGQLLFAYTENPYAIARKAEVRVTYTYNCMVTQWGETMETPIEVSSIVAVEQAANTSVTPLTFKITVKESHYDHILVDVTPSDLNATYILNAVNVEDFGWYYSDWSKCCANDLRYIDELSHTGKLTNYKLAINTYYIDDWSYYVYAFGVDVAASAVAGDATYVEVEVVNDTPTISLDENLEVAPGVKIVYNENTGNYELHIPAEGGTYTVKWNIKNGVENGVVRINNIASDVVSDTYKVLVNNNTTEWWNDAEQTFTFSVNPYDTAVTQTYKHQVTIYLRYYTDATKSQAAGQAISLKVIQTAP